jgi:hypothetical protein
MTVRNRRIAVLATTLALLGAGFTRASAQAAAPCDRACVVGVADQYLAALVDHDGSDVPLADSAWRVENGGNSGNSGEEIRAGLEAPIMYVITGIRELEWYVSFNEDGSANAIAVYFLDTVTSPTYIFERFLVRDRLIHEIEAVFRIDIPGYLVGPESVLSRPGGQLERVLASQHGPLGPVPVPVLGGTGSEPGAPRAGCGACATDAGQAYVDALVSHAAAAVPLAAGASRTENRIGRGDNAASIRATLATSRVVREIRNVRWWSDGGQAVALYELRTASGWQEVATRVQAPAGVITQIESVCVSTATCS